MDIEQRLKELNITLPEISIPAGLPIVSGVIVGDLVFMSGHTPTVNGKPQYVGTVGCEINMTMAGEATRLATLNCISAMKNTIGDLNRVVRIIKLNGFVASEKGFVDQAKVINTASNLILDIFGDKGNHARAALGVAALPDGVPVEIELIAQIQ